MHDSRCAVAGCQLLIANCTVNRRAVVLLANELFEAMKKGN